MSGEGYAPKSPDLSALFADPTPPPAQGGLQALNQPYSHQYAPQQHAQYPPQQQQQQQQHLQPPTQQGYYQPPPQHYSTTQQPPQQHQHQQHQPPPPHNLGYLQSPPQHQQHLQQHQQSASPQSAQQPYYVQAPHHQQQHQQQQPPYYQAYSAPQYQQPGPIASPPAPPQYGQRYQSPGDLFATDPFAGDSSYPQQQHQQHQQQQPLSYDQQQQQQLLQPLQQQPYGQPSASPIKSEPGTGAMPPRRSAAAAAAAAMAASASAEQQQDQLQQQQMQQHQLQQHHQQQQTLAPPAPAQSHVILTSPVRTKFPTARIKRIMQADEEVGKVSQQTPIAVGKALEMFMVNLVSKSADVARTKNSKRVTAQMLKQVVESDDQWDFLRDIVKKVDPEEKHGRGPRNSTGGAGAAAGEGGGPAGGTKLKSESDSGDDQPKKRGRPARKKKV
ncbi:hypothetical protein SBRCBS47491_004147 [Sporothrix bragantina]|uniref:Transcription factor CBF/NF-Y/archaeal histone domain-containing protein n=1 Tax=Sporothrix bragantina TaxID=671064 RepID=A0ABP0BM77_9PEZI